VLVSKNTNGLRTKPLAIRFLERCVNALQVQKEVTIMTKHALMALTLVASMVTGVSWATDMATPQAEANAPAMEKCATKKPCKAKRACCKMSRKSKANVVDAAMADGQFTTLTKALEAAGLTETLKGKGPYTLFAPTDSAFSALPAGTLDELLKPENRERLQQVLTYHVVPGRVSSKAVMGLKEAKSVAGGMLTVSQDHGAVMINSSNVVKTDINTKNGVIHVIDKVLIPGS
jgi:uncharacterized surface protein with fasciclin (FAS1) repeats